MSEETLITRYAKPQELAAVEAARKAAADADQQWEHIAAVLRDTQLAVQQASMRPSWRAEVAAARALGEAVPGHLPAPPLTGQSLTELQDQERGLKDRWRKSQDAAIAAHGKARALWMELLAECARRCMADYIQHTQQQAWCHLQIAAAQNVLGAGARIVDEISWNHYKVPGSEHVGREHTQLEWGLPMLASADRESLALPPLIHSLRPEEN